MESPLTSTDFDMGLWRRNAGLPLSVAYRFGIGLGPVGLTSPVITVIVITNVFRFLSLLLSKSNWFGFSLSFKLPALLVFNIRLLQNLIQAYIGLLLVVIRPVHSADTASS